MEEREDLTAAGFTADAMMAADGREVEEVSRATYQEKRDKDIQKSIDKANQASFKVAAERSKLDAKAGAKREAELEDAQKKPYLQKIQLYVERFPFLQDKLMVKVTQRTSLPELVYILTLIRNEMDTRSSLNRLVGGVDVGLLFLEGTWGDGSKMVFLPNELRFNLTGLHRMWKEGLFMEDILPVLQEVDIEYPWLGRQTLPMRGISSLMTVLVKVNLANRSPLAKAAMETQNAKPIDPQREP